MINKQKEITNYISKVFLLLIIAFCFIKCTNEKKTHIKNEIVEYEKIDMNNVFLNIIHPFLKQEYILKPSKSDKLNFTFDSTLFNKYISAELKRKYSFKNKIFKNSDSLFLSIGYISDSLIVIYNKDTLLNKYIRESYVGSSFEITIPKKEGYNEIHFKLKGLTFTSVVDKDFDCIFFIYNSMNGYDIIYKNEKGVYE
jgi:hypothetical protein